MSDGEYSDFDDIGPDDDAGYDEAFDIESIVREWLDDRGLPVDLGINVDFADIANLADIRGNAFVDITDALEYLGRDIGLLSIGHIVEIDELFYVVIPDDTLGVGQ